MVDTCKLCGSHSPLVRRSHVIPQWMYALLPKDSRGFGIASSHVGEFQKKSQTGFYGKFVCQACENLFSRWDDHAAIVLRRMPTLTASGWDYGPYVYGDLTRFYLSVLWRASACGHSFFETVDLRDSQTPVATALLSTSDASLEEFDVLPSNSKHLLTNVVLPPIEVPIGTIPYWQLYMPRYQALIKVVQRPGVTSLQSHKLRPHSRLLLCEKSFSEFGEDTATIQIFKANMEKKNARRR